MKKIVLIAFMLAICVATGRAQESRQDFSISGTVLIPPFRASQTAVQASAQREFNAVFDTLHLSVWYLSVLYTGSGGPGRTVYNCLHLDVSFWPNILVSYCYIRILLFFLNGTRLAPDRVPRPRLGKSTYGENTNEYHASQDVCEVPGPDGPRRRPGSGLICLGSCFDRPRRHRCHENFGRCYQHRVLEHRHPIRGHRLTPVNIPSGQIHPSAFAGEMRPPDLARRRILSG